MEIRIDYDSLDKEITSLIGKLKAVGMLTTTNAEQMVRTLTDKLEDESVKRTPIDEGFLAQSHEKKVEVTPSRVTGHVFIPANSPASDYAVPMHEHFYNLGEASRAKQAGSKVTVGRKYLERALFENAAAFKTYIVMKCRELFK